MCLIVGEGIVDSKFVIGEGEVIVYVNVLVFEVLLMFINVLGILMNIDLYLFIFIVNSVCVYLVGSLLVQVEMNYSLLCNEEIEMGENEYKFIFILIDQVGKIFEKELVIGIDLKIGIN